MLFNMVKLTLLVLAILISGVTASKFWPSPRDKLAYAPTAAGVAVPFSLSKTLGSNMVLQRAPASAVVWGFATAGATVKTTFQGSSYVATADATNVWRQSLPPTAPGPAVTISFAASTGEATMLTNVLFGDVYICSGQSNMQFSLEANINATAEAQAANNYPNIRLFTVGQGTSSTTPLTDLKTIEQTWSVASNVSVTAGGGWGYFSAVCWFFGKQVSDGLSNQVPLGLISSNWGGTPIEHWSDAPAFKRCNRTDTDSTLYNAMIYPYVVGPMALTGFTWYQGEANTGSQQSADAYACLFPSMIQSWRTNFNVPKAFFGYIELSTWCNVNFLPQMRDAQYAAVTTQGAGFAVNSDHGKGCDIHPTQKQNCGERLGASALSKVYGQNIAWESPSYAGIASLAPGSATIKLTNVLPAGLVILPSANEGTLNCATTPNTCAWAGLQFNDAQKTWVNATVGLSSDRQAIVLSAVPPAGASAIITTSYGWGMVPFLTVYRADRDLPVRAWQQPVA